MPAPRIERAPGPPGATGPRIYRSTSASSPGPSLIEAEDLFRLSRNKNTKRYETILAHNFEAFNPIFRILSSADEASSGLKPLSNDSVRFFPTRTIAGWSALPFFSKIKMLYSFVGRIRYAPDKTFFLQFYRRSCSRRFIITPRRCRVVRTSAVQFVQRHQDCVVTPSDMVGSQLFRKVSLNCTMRIVLPALPVR